MKKILFVIDTLGSGGAQRQLVGLACFLASRGYVVSVVSYYVNHFYDEQLKKFGVNIISPDENKSGVNKIFWVKEALQSVNPSVVISFLGGANAISEFIKVFYKFKFKLIVSERHNDVKMSPKIFFRFLAHGVANYLVVNSHAQASFVLRNSFNLKSKTKCIVNFVDTDKFKPCEKTGGSEINILMLASYTKNKNLANLLVAIKNLPSDFNVNLRCYGNKNVFDGDSVNSDYYEKCLMYVCNNGLNNVVLNGESKSVGELFDSADVLCLPSLSEATPNVICEALASGVIIIASRVGDIPIMVEDGVNGFLFDPENSEDICNAIKKVYFLDEDAKNAIRHINRKKALDFYSANSFVNNFVELIN